MFNTDMFYSYFGTQTNFFIIVDLAIIISGIVVISIGVLHFYNWIFSKMLEADMNKIDKMNQDELNNYINSKNPNKIKKTNMYIAHSYYIERSVWLSYNSKAKLGSWIANNRNAFSYKQVLAKYYKLT